jgi:hypothetical protein
MPVGTVPGADVNTARSRRSAPCQRRFSWIDDADLEQVPAGPDPGGGHERRPPASRKIGRGRRHGDQLHAAVEPNLDRLHVGDLKVVLDPVRIGDGSRVDRGRVIGHVAQQYAQAISDLKLARGLMRSVARLIGRLFVDVFPRSQPAHQLARDRARRLQQLPAGDHPVPNEMIQGVAEVLRDLLGAEQAAKRALLAGLELGLLATAVTYLLVQAIIHALGDGGLRLPAITGLIAIVVLLVVTNWFFHRVYWSEWIARFNRRRKTLERIDRLGFISGQTVGFVILGLTSVYREGFETVLFLQNLQVSAGTAATVLGVTIGLAATHRRMLIATGILIGLVLAVIVGTTVNNLQGLGWLPTNNLGLLIDPRLSQWTGLYPTWEGITAQLAALLIVYGSYALARQLQRRRCTAATPALVHE